MILSLPNGRVIYIFKAYRDPLCGLNLEAEYIDTERLISDDDARWVIGYRQEQLEQLFREQEESLSG